MAQPAFSGRTLPFVHLTHCSAVPTQGQRLGQAMQVLMWGSLARCFLAWRDDTQVRHTAHFHLVQPIFIWLSGTGDAFQLEALFATFSGRPV